MNTDCADLKHRIILIIAIIIILIHALICVEGKKRSGGRFTNRPKKKSATIVAHRKYVIKCCGRKSCLNVPTKVKPKWTSTSTTRNILPLNNSHTILSKTVHEVLSKEESVTEEFEDSVDGGGQPEKTSESSVTVIAVSEESSTQTEAEESSAGIPEVSLTSDSTSLSDSTTILMDSTSIRSSSVSLSASASSPSSTSTTIPSTEATISVTILSSLSTSSSSQSASTTITNTTPTSTTSSPSTTITTPTSTTSTTSTSTTTTTTTKATTTTTLNLRKPTTPPTMKPVEYPACPSSCKIEKSYFKTDGSLDDPDYHGFWNTVCGKLYMFGKILVNWEQNVAACCKLGMEPISFQSETERMCFDGFINGKYWRFNSRYWTYGLRSSESSFQWCSNTSLSVMSTIWSFGQPNNANGTENCVQMVVNKENSTVMLEDRHCGVVSALACQGPTTPTPSCVSPLCPNVTCAKNASFYKILPDKKTGYLLNPTQHGTWVTVDDKSYMFSYSNDTRTFRGALSACCSVGLKLLSLHQAFQYPAITKALQKVGLRNASFWTSATDEGCEGSFGYCSTNRLLRTEAMIWKYGQPDNDLGNEHCLTVEISAESALLSDFDCFKKFQYICEGRLKTGAATVEKECAGVYNLTAEEVNALLFNAAKSLQEKCFLKCYGEGTEMFVNGKLAEEKVLSQLASISSGDVNKLMDMYSTFNFCSNVSKGMDLCDKASKLLQCGKENSPEAVSALMKNLENSLSDAPVNFPPQQAVCATDYNCVIDDDRKVGFDLAAHAAQINFPNIVGQVTHACEKKFLFIQHATSLTYIQAMEMCCSFGMRLVRIETKTKLDCMITAGVHSSFPSFAVYAVAASRMGYISKPVWCHNNEAINLTWFPVQYSTGNTNNNDVAISIKFVPSTVLYITADGGLNYIGCESL